MKEKENLNNIISFRIFFFHTIILSSKLMIFRQNELQLN